jgi:type VI secretion system secreted protein Hcp
MPTPAYLTIEGTTQDNITKSAFTEDSAGNIYQEGHENEILVQAFEQSSQCLSIHRADSQQGSGTKP